MALEVFIHLYGEETISTDNNYLDSGKLFAIDISANNSADAYVSDYHFLYVPNACFKE